MCHPHPILPHSLPHYHPAPLIPPSVPASPLSRSGTRLALAGMSAQARVFTRWVPVAQIQAPQPATLAQPNHSMSYKRVRHTTTLSPAHTLPHDHLATPPRPHMPLYLASLHKWQSPPDHSHPHGPLVPATCPHSLFTPQHTYRHTCHRAHTSCHPTPTYTPLR